MTILTIQQMLQLPVPAVYVSSKAQPVASSCPELLYGVELEIERVPNWVEMVVEGLDCKEDGSLRNHGREFITYPMTFSNLSHVLNKFFDRNNLSSANYSDRTSVHVHANCLDLQLDQLSSIVLLYQVFEKLLLQFIGNDRDKNIFCVPLNETVITPQIVSALVDGKNITSVKRWMKYTALNLLPIYDLGTIEFRHMEGTCDVNRILKWCDMIGCLFQSAKARDLDSIKGDIITLNTNSHYEMLLHTVFHGHAHGMEYPGWRQDLEEGVLNVKYNLINSDTKNTTPWRDGLLLRPFGADAIRQQQEINNFWTQAGPPPAVAPEPFRPHMVFDDLYEEDQDPPEEDMGEDYEDGDQP